MGDTVGFRNRLLTTQTMEQFIHQIRALVILDAEGKRMYSKYFASDYKDQFNKQEQLEKNIYSKTQKINAVADRMLYFKFLTVE
jgi:hypothetical protein